MEWDKLNGNNERAWDKVCPRGLAVFAKNAVTLHLSNFADVYGKDSTSAQKMTPFLPKDKGGKEHGLRSLLLTPQISLEGADAALLRPGMEINLLRWMNAVVERVEGQAQDG